MKFNTKLQDLRKQRGLSQEALAERLNVSRQAVSKWETGDGYPEMDKIILLSDMFEVSLDYLIKDTDESVEQKKTERGCFMNSQKIKEYTDYKKKFGIYIGLAVAMLILSPLLSVWTSDTAYEKVGIFGMFTLVAIAVATLIIVGLSSEKHHELEEKKIDMSFNDLQRLQEEYSRFKSKFGMSIAIGVAVIILAVAGVILVGEGRFSDNVGSTLLLSCVAFSVFTFIYMGVKDGAYKFLVQNRKYIAQKSEEENSLFAVTMPLAAMIYLIIGFVTGYWHPGWLVFPITAIVTSAIEALRSRGCNNNEK